MERFRRFLAEMLRPEKQKQSPAEKAQEENRRAEETRRERLAAITEKITHLEEKLRREGVRFDTDFLARNGVGTNIPEIFALYSLLQERAERPAISIVMGKDFSLSETLQRIYQQVFPEAGARKEDYEIFRALEKAYFSLAITIDPSLQETLSNNERGEKIYTNQNIHFFQLNVRSLIQHHRIPVCVFSEDIDLIPIELIMTHGVVSSRPRGMKK